MLEIVGYSFITPCDHCNKAALDKGVAGCEKCNGAGWLTNEKQNLFFDTVMRAVARCVGYEFLYFFYGGAIRGGKTYVCLYIFHELAKAFPGSIWYVIRDDNPALEATSIPSMQKMIGKEGSYFRWYRGKGNVQVVYKNGSRIIFKSENLQKDKELKDFLGLEMNGCLLEQMEGLSELLFERCIERIGSWYIDPMPIPLMLGTFNPTPTWTKKKIYDPYIKGELEKPYFYQPALPDDNPHVTKEQWANWRNLDPASQTVMIKGIWQFKVQGNIWAYAFSEERNVKPADLLDATGKALKDEHGRPLPNPYFAIDRRLPVYLVFDFNVDPMTCLVCQRDSMFWGKVIKEYRLRTSDIFDMCDAIKADFGSFNESGEWIADYYLVVTGDASGRNRDGNSRGKKSYVDNIVAQLNLSTRQNDFPLSNPSIDNTRIVVNSVFHNHPEFFISSACPFLIDDLLTIKTTETGEIDTKKMDPLKTHLFSNMRYFAWNYFRRWVKKSW